MSARERDFVAHERGGRYVVHSPPDVSACSQSGPPATGSCFADERRDGDGGHGDLRPVRVGGQLCDSAGRGEQGECERPVALPVELRGAEGSVDAGAGVEPVPQCGEEVLQRAVLPEGRDGLVVERVRSAQSLGEGDSADDFVIVFVLVASL